MNFIPSHNTNTFFNKLPDDFQKISKSKSGTSYLSVMSFMYDPLKQACTTYGFKSGPRRPKSCILSWFLSLKHSLICKNILVLALEHAKKNLFGPPRELSCAPLPYVKSYFCDVQILLLP
jgi:hypothetical protein